MTTTSCFVLRNTALGSETRHRTVADALAAVYSTVGEREHWVIFEFDSSPFGGSAEVITHGCGHEVPALLDLTRVHAMAGR
jgi:hypothetical protein